jgi:hypothetical protein
MTASEPAADIKLQTLLARGGPSTHVIVDRCLSVAAAAARVASMARLRHNLATYI